MNVHLLNSKKSTKIHSNVHKIMKAIYERDIH